MTEFRRPKEQIAVHTYRHRLPDEVGVSTARSGAGGISAKVDIARQRRVVTMPNSVVEPTLWAERQAHQRQAHAKPRTHHNNSRLRPRTLAQTGIPASSGQIRIIQPLPRRHVGSPIPVRSGRNARGGLWGRLLALFAVVVIGIVGITFALTSSTFRIQEVNVVGAQNAALVKNIQHMGMQGQNIFLLDTAAFTALITALPLVASASLGKQLPNQVTVSVVERTPVLLWQTQQGTYSVDKTGMVMALASETIGADHLMTVVDMRASGGTGQQSIHPGVHLNALDIAFATEVFTSLPQVAGISDFKLSYDYAGQSNGSYVVESPDGWIAYLGSAENSNPLDNRLIELKQILFFAQQKQLNLATIDLRFGLRPVYTLKS